ncbi:hypothetical protein ACN6MY_03685 [Peribacillus sp. B-H-3]|uniref:hypothetical protein n=1 Tax=Peribacillus sp. B-H-3 TaxID=3400420 RepID=UPI003B01CBD4
MIVRNTDKYVRHIGVRLVPGDNELSLSDQEKFQEVYSNPLNQHLLKDIEIVDEAEEQALAAEPESIPVPEQEAGGLGDKPDKLKKKVK